MNRISDKKLFTHLYYSQEEYKMNRKTLSLVLTLLLVLSFGPNALAQTGNVDVRITSGVTFTDTLNGLQAQVDQNGTYTFMTSVTCDFQISATTLGFRYYSPDASVANVTFDTLNYDSFFVWYNVWSLGGAQYSYKTNNVLPDTILIGGAAFSGGFGPATNTDVWGIDISFSQNSQGIFCIDTTFIPPAGPWLFADGTNISPTWGAGNGPYSQNGFCVTLFEVPCLPPIVSNAPGALQTSHCDVLTYDLDATEGNNVPVPQDPVLWSITSAPSCGTADIDANSGVLTYTPDASCVGQAISVTATATNACQGFTDVVIDITVTNNAPSLTCPPDFAVAKGGTNTSAPATGSDVDPCDNISYSLCGPVNPVPLGSVSIDPNTGAVTFNADVNDADDANSASKFYDVYVCLTDGITTVACTLTVEVQFTEPFCVTIQQRDDVIQGGHVQVYITFDAGSNEIGGFDFLIQYDPSALSFTGATKGNIFADYGWEFFTYRFGPTGNCTGGCPSGKLRIIGIAETNDKFNHPNNYNLAVGDTLACLDFLVTNDRNLGCQFAAIRFCWLDCGDNSLSSKFGDTLYISRNVYDYESTGDFGPEFNRADITGLDQSFPTFTGAPDICDSEDKRIPIRFLDLKNGGVHIACPRDIDDRGDLNLNGLANEIADAVLYTAYFIKGIGAFIIGVDAQVAASEINGDGVPLTVADLVLLIRIIVGDALPLHQPLKLAHYANTATITSVGSVVSTDTEMGAALFVFEGETEVTLLQDNAMAIEVGVREGNTYVLIVPSMNEIDDVVNDPSARIEVGQVLSANAELISVEAAEFYGAALNVAFKIVPTDFVLHQNYPNPFNPSTKIGFALPTSSAYTVSIYNVAGQLVDVIEGQSEAGEVTVVWNASNAASGIYFYKVDAGQFSATKKMVFLK